MAKGRRKKVVSLARFFANTAKFREPLLVWHARSLEREEEKREFSFSSFSLSYKNITLPPLPILSYSSMPPYGEPDWASPGDTTNNATSVTGVTAAPQASGQNANTADDR